MQSQRHPSEPAPTTSDLPAPGRPAAIVNELALAFHRNRAHLQSVPEVTSSGIHILDPEGLLLAANPAFLSMLGHDESAINRLKVSDWDLHSTTRHAAKRDVIMHPLSSPSGHFSECRYKRYDGSLIDVEVEAYAISIDGQDRICCTSRDITKHKLSEASLPDLEQHLRTAIDKAPAMIGYWDKDLRNRFGNCGYASWFGVDPSKMMGKHMREVIGEANYQFNARCITAALNGQYQQFEYALPTTDSAQVRHSLAQYIPDAVAGDVRGFYAILTDITRLKKTELSPRDDEEQMRIAAIAFDTQQGMFIADADRVILRVNKAFTEITGYSAPEAVGQTPRLLSSGRHDRAFYAAMWESINRTGSWQGEIWNRRKNGKVFPETLRISTVRDAAGWVSHYVAAFSDSTSYKAAEEQIQSLAFYDPLTGLPNRQHLIVLLQQAQLAGARNQRQDALLLVDLDQFKSLNETMGHENGNLLLQNVAQRLGACIRKHDTLARLGGGTFVVLLQNLSHIPEQATSEAEAVAGKILLALKQAYRIDRSDVHCSASVGITLVDGAGLQDAGRTLNQAELAARHAKVDGRNSLRFFQSQMLTEVSARAALESGLRGALLEGQFVLHYQAQVTNDGRIIGAEALVRWQHPARGMVSPAEFIQVAEDSGLILPLGNWVLETACRQLAQWAGKPETADLTMAVNVSAHQFHQADFVDQVLAALERSGARAHRLKLELTESLLITQVDAIIAKMNALKARGVCFSLDDFGTGYSSLSILKRLPLDQLKIDQSFVRNILLNADDAAIAEMVIALAVRMGMAVIAEGVETEAQRDFLAQLGCHTYQGYLFSRPVPILEFDALVAKTKDTSNAAGIGSI